MTAIAKKSYYTADEYFDILAQSDHRYEYHDGEIFMMAGGSDTHNKIAFNFGGELYNQLKRSPCSGRQSDAKVHLANANSYVFPDLLVICGDPQFHNDRADTITNPSVIIEVLSKGTESYDRGEKFRKYQTLESLQQYVLVSQTQALVEVFTRYRETGKWIYQQFTGLDAILNLSSINAEIKLDDIYYNVDFESKIESDVTSDELSEE